MDQEKKRVHFIAIGGSVMHNLAVALKKTGYQISGSDDEIFDPAQSALKKYDLLPAKPGWFPEKITKEVNTVILGMHARKDNPELKRAEELGIEILSFPEFIFKASSDKQRIVIAGSHGKSTITGMIVHVLQYLGRSFDFVMGAAVKGEELTVKLSTEAPIIVIEGDEYLSSTKDSIPKFLNYHHHIGLISGIAWDHANVFPTENEYVKQFDLFADSTPKGGILVYCENDALANVIGAKERADVQTFAYRKEKDPIPMKAIGSHNQLNARGAMEVLKKIGVTADQFFEAIASFEGVAGRLQLIGEGRTSLVFKDFAHAPSKVKATVKALKELHPERKLVSCLELHTYSSLNKNFLPQYQGSFKGTDLALVYFNPEKVKSKKLEPLNTNIIEQAFGSPAPLVFDDAGELEKFLLEQNWSNKNLLLMSSGDFGGLDISKITTQVTS